METVPQLRVEEQGGGWVLAGPAAGVFGLVDDYLAYLVDRNYSRGPRGSRTVGPLPSCCTGDE